jgi:glycosyltransferase involved in cell wall biosynthesis
MSPNHQSPSTAPPGARLIALNRYFHPDISATSQLASDLLAALAAQGWPVTVIASAQRYDDPDADLPASESWCGVNILRVARTRFGRARLPGRLLDYLAYYIAASRALWRIADRTALVLVMTDPPLMGLPAAWICRRRGALLVQWLQDVLPEVAVGMGALRAGAVTHRLQSWRDRSLRASARVVTIAERMAARLARTSGRSVDVIPNWALEETPASPEDIAALRRHWQLGPACVIGYSGNMGRAHRLGELIEAAALLRDSRDWILLFVGGGAQRERLLARATALRLDNVRFEPYQPRARLAASLCVADVHVVSLDASLEGLILPSKFVAALALGRPVLWIGAADGEIGQLVRDWQCGVCVPPGDVAALTTALRSLIDGSPEAVATRRAMGARARELWATKFRRQAAIDAWSRLLREVATTQAPAPAATAGGTHARE